MLAPHAPTPGRPRRTPSLRTRHRRARPGAPNGSGQTRPQMTPMVDVSFLLLIFFMLTIQFKTLEGLLGAQLPRFGAAAVDAIPPEPVYVGLEVLNVGTRLELDSDRPWDGSGPFRFGPDRLIRWSVGPWSTTDRDALGERLRGLHRYEPDRTVLIDAFPGVVYAEAVDVLDAIRLAGWSKISFVGSRE